MNSVATHPAGISDASTLLLSVFAFGIVGLIIVAVFVIAPLRERRKTRPDTTPEGMLR